MKIIEADLDSNMKILACAGSGKTTTLVMRLDYLVRKGVDPSKIIVSTFNVEAGN
jgi:DNA helicase II / ATP-dependent DNA helicase PcrA